MTAIFKRLALMTLPAALAATAIACVGSAQGNSPPTISPDVFAPIPTPRPFGQPPTPSPTPFVLPQPTSTPTPVATPEPTVTPTLPGAPTEPGPTVSPTAEATTVPTPVATATPSPAVEATFEPTSTPELSETSMPATATATPEPTATAAPSEPAGIVYQAETGQIVHDPENLRPETMSTGADVANFSVETTFGNPFHATFRPYSYGVKFRDSGDQYHVVAIESDGSVQYMIGVPGEEGAVDTFTVMHEFEYDGALTEGSDSNYMRLTVIEERGWLYVNGELLDEFTVGGVGVSSDLAMVAELHNETDISGAVVDLTNMIVRRAGVAANIEQGSLVKETGQVSRTAPTSPVRDSVVTVSFVSPYESILGRWTVGMEFHEPVSGAANWIVFDDRGRWKHYRQEAPGADVVELEGDLINWMNRDRGEVNDLLVIGAAGTFEVFLNGQHVTTLTFEESDVPATISAIAGFNETDQPDGAPTQFSNYTVWSLGE